MWLLALVLAAPIFTADGVRPSNGARAIPLSPGMLVSIYGSHLGPALPCQIQGSFPKELCGVQVMMGEQAAGLLYVSERQINFKVPQESPVEGVAKLRVIYNGESSPVVMMPLGAEMVTLSLDEPARAGGPVWIHLESPPSWHEWIQYPITIYPGDLGCHEFEVRRNGVPQLRIDPKVTGLAFGGGIHGSGPGSLTSCGSLGMAGHPLHHGSLPLHLQYRFSEPGVYEIRYTRRRARFVPGDDIVLQSVWTRITILPAAAVKIGVPPQDAAEILSDFLPNILANPGAARLAVVCEYLYHPEETVRRYAANALGYWPADEVERRLEALAQTKGPSNAVVDQILTAAPDLAEGMLKYLGSNDPVLVRGALIAARRVSMENRQPYSEAMKTRTVDALLASAEHVIHLGDAQAGSDVVSQLGAAKDPRVRPFLWSLVDRRLVYEQALTAITWQKNPDDLPRLALILARDPQLAMLPYHLRNAYGAPAIPVLEEALRRSDQVRLQTNCARELINEGRPSGYAFVAEAIEQNRPDKRELIQSVRDRFAELRYADDAAMLAFVKQRAKGN